MNMLGPKMGTWSVKSKSEPKFNGAGRAEGLVCSGGPQEIDRWIEKCKAKYGYLPPDLIKSFMKD